MLSGAGAGQNWTGSTTLQFRVPGTNEADTRRDFDGITVPSPRGVKKDKPNDHGSHIFVSQSCLVFIGNRLSIVSYNR